MALALAGQHVVGGREARGRTARSPEPRAQDHVDATRPGTDAVRAVRADDEVVQAVSVDVSGGDRDARFVVGGDPRPGVVVDARADPPAEAQP